MSPAPFTLPMPAQEAFRLALTELPPIIRNLLPRDPEDAIRQVVSCNDGLGYKLPFTGGMVVFHPGFGISAIWGGAFSKWSELGAEDGILGYPMGNASDKTGTFERGRIFDATYALFGPLYARWLQLPLPRPRPTGDTEAIVSGQLLAIALEEQTALIWQADRPAALRISQRIFQKWLSLGGLGSRLGPPQGDSFTLDTKRQVTAQTFAFGIIVAYGDSSTFALYGPIHARWMSLGDVSSKLGLPLSDVGAEGGVEYADFEGGVIFARGLDSYALSDLTFRIWRMKITGNDEVGTAPDLYAKVTLTGSRVKKIVNPNPSSYSARLPDSGDYGTDDVTLGRGSKAKIELKNIRHDAWIEYRIEGWDNDVLSQDDAQGTVAGRIALADLFWQDVDGNKTKKNGSLTVELQVDAGPSADVDEYFRHNHWWSFSNFSKSTLGEDIYAETFSDVTTADTWLLDPLNQAYYSLVYKGIAANGHCFGMALEALDTLRGTGLFQPRTYAHPLNPSESGGLRRQLHRKHGYQLGAPCVAWFLDLFTNGKTHNPRWNFDRALALHSQGEGSIVCMTPEYFSVAGHAVLPYRFIVDEAKNPSRRIFVADPNVPWDSVSQDKPEGSNFALDNKISIQVKETTDPDDPGKFFYDNGDRNYIGEGWTGGRLYHIPHSVLASQPSTASGMLLTPGGAIAAVLLVILGGDAGVQQATDEAGRRFYRSEPPRRWEDISPDPHARPSGLARIPLMSAGVAGEIYAVGQRAKYDWFRKRVVQAPGRIPQALKWTVAIAKDRGRYSLAFGGGVCRHRVELKGGSKDHQDEFEMGGIASRAVALQIRPKQGRRSAELNSAIGTVDTGGVHSFAVTGLSAVEGQSLGIAADVPGRKLMLTGALAGMSISVTLTVAGVGGTLRRVGQIVVPDRGGVLELRLSVEPKDRLEAVVKERLGGAVLSRLHL